MAERRTLVVCTGNIFRSLAAVEAHVRVTIDRIVDMAPRMAQNIDALMEKYGRRET